MDTVLFQGPATAMGAFRCPVGHPTFSDSGPAERCIVVFPRSSVWIRHEGSRAFVADPNVVTIYNRGQRYARAPLSPEGDRCDWFAVSDNVARDIVSAFDAKAADAVGGPFRFESAPTSLPLYVAQRRALRRAIDDPDPLRLEEEVIGIVTRVLANAYQRRPESLSTRASAVRRRQELAEQTKAELLRTVTINRSVGDIAAAVGTSQFHLCRVFRAATGQTLHAYRTEARLRLALELLADGGRELTLSHIAHALGFSSHAHFVRVSRRHFETVPGAVRDLLRQPG